jgi:hypothetical protein
MKKELLYIIASLTLMICSCGTVQQPSDTPAFEEKSTTSLPTEIPTHTAVPTQIPTLSPTDTHTPVPEFTEKPTIDRESGIGVPRETLQDVFEDFGLEFFPPTIEDGEEVVSGATVDSIGLFVSLSLFGPEENLTQALLLIGLDSGDPTATYEGMMTYLQIFIEEALSGWDEGSDWLVETVAQSQIGGLYTTTFENVEINLGVYEREDGAVAVGLEIGLIE